jgi:hypothetical protein
MAAQRAPDCTLDGILTSRFGLFDPGAGDGKVLPGQSVSPFPAVCKSPERADPKVRRTDLIELARLGAISLRFLAQQEGCAT